MPTANYNFAAANSLTLVIYYINFVYEIRRTRPREILTKTTTTAQMLQPRRPRLYMQLYYMPGEME